MKLLADECVAGSTVAAMRAAGFDVEWIAEALPGAADADVLARAFGAGRLLLTEDKDFGELTIRFGHAFHGVVLVALAGLPAAARAARTVAALQALGDRGAGQFVVIEQHRIRRRALGAPGKPERPR